MPLRDGYGRRILTGVGFAIGALVILATGHFVVTAGEHAERVTESLLETVLAGDHPAVMKLFSDDARLHIGAPTNPGVPLGVINRNLAYVMDRYTIESNRATSLRGFTVRDDEGVVHLGCYTETGAAIGLSKWHLRVHRDNGVWRIVDLTWIELNRSPPSARYLRP